jgi:hypothetical protein
VIRESLLAFYQEYCPQAADYVDFILVDRTVSELLGGCEQRYGSKPDTITLPKAKGALIKVDISSNIIRCTGATVLAGALQGNQVIKELNLSCNSMTHDDVYGIDMSGVVALADVIPGMGALTSFNISNNQLAQGALKDGMSGFDVGSDYETDMAGDMLNGRTFTSSPFLQVPNRHLFSIFTGVTALANAIPGMGALASLNLATNALGQDGALIICDALLGSRYAVCTSYALPARAHQ